MDDEITYATANEQIPDENASVCSEISEAASERSDVSEPREMEEGPTKDTSKLREMMLERIESIDIIRNLVEKELEQDSALIAEFTEKVLELETDVTRKNHEIECLKDAEKEMQLEIQQLKTKNGGCAEELSALAARIDLLADRNAQLETQNKSLAAAAESVHPIKARNQQMEEIISSITASLKDAKRCLEREMAYTARLEKEKAHAAEHAAKLGQDHNFEIESFKKRLEREAQAQLQLRKEMDALRKELCDEQLNNTKLSSIQVSLVSAEQCIGRLGAEKNVLAQELAEAKKKNEALEDKVKASNAQTDPIKILKDELEAMSAKLSSGEVQMEDSQLMDLQGVYWYNCILVVSAIPCVYSHLRRKHHLTHFLCMSIRTLSLSTARLVEADRCLSVVTSEKAQLLVALGEVQPINHHISFDIKESRSGSSEVVDWIVEKKSMERRLIESDQALVLLAKENEELQNTIGKIMEENRRIKANGESVATEAAGESKEEKLSSELSTLKLSFYKEKKKMMARQQELEGLLIEALKERFGGETNEVILKKLGEAQLEITGGGKKKNVVAE
ncbi:hypothetical protein HJC23_012913 [Cyclotella cryptica]|uniref:Uncharacterized protein n=1 Tax=Cyclotella cryptica TaxID=29204 RepID=A0ABD3Q4D1_9STRA